MANPDIRDATVRKKIIDEIKGNENVSRKLSEQRKFDIYRRRQAGYVLENLYKEFDKKTVRDMRTVLSINPCKRIVDEQASLYVEEPERHWVDANEAEENQLDELYECGKVDPQMRLANRYFKLHGQACLYVLPKDGKIMPRALTPKDYDVIPDDEDPEKAFAYIINVFDPSKHTTGTPGAIDWSDNRFVTGNRYSQTDNRNQIIADENDKRMKERYVFWTAEAHLTCDGNGEIVDGHNEENPIGMLPFVDIANEKDFNFFVNLGSDVAEFVIDLLTQLSDLANTTRMQNYSQAVIASINQPTSVTIGPNKVLWLQVDPNADQGSRPSFEFVSPSPDIMGSLELINVELKMFLSSHGLNPGTVSGKNEIEKFTSGIDHLLANLDKFKASKEDMDIFRNSEMQLFDLMRAWHEIMFDVTDENTMLDEELRQTRLSDAIELNIAYREPHAVQTQTEVEDSVIKLTKAGLMTKVEAVKRIYGVDDDKANEIVAELDAEKQANMSQGLGPDGQPLPPQMGPDGQPIDPNDPNAVDPNADPNDPNIIDESGKKPFPEPDPAATVPKKSINVPKKGTKKPPPPKGKK